MIEQVSNALVFYAHYVASKVGKTSLTVTVDVYRNGVEVVTAASAVEMGDGLYSYTLASSSVSAEGEYIAVFHTTDTSVDQRDLPALWVIQKAGVEHLDENVSAAKTLTAAYDAAKTAAQAGDAMDLIDGALDAGAGYTAPDNASVAEILTDTGTDGVVVAAASKTGYALSGAGVQAIWDALSSALTTIGSIGKRIVDYLTGDAFARLGAPAGASVSADIATVDTVVDAIKLKTDLITTGTALTIVSPVDGDTITLTRDTMLSGTLTIQRDSRRARHVG